MRSRKSLLLAPILLLAATNARADDRNEVVMQKLYSKIENALALSSTSAPGSAAGLLIASPSYVIDQKNVDYDTPDGEKLISDLIDNAPQPKWLWRASGTYEAALYNKILGFHETPEITLSDTEKTQLAIARKYLYADSAFTKPSAVQKAYDGYRDAFYAAAGALQGWNSEHPHQTPPANLTSAHTKSLSNWRTLGHKTEVEAARSTLEVLNNKDPAAFWGALRGQYDDNQVPLGAGSFPKYEFYPVYKSWIDNSQNWNAIKLDDTDLDKVATSSHVSWGGGFSAGWGMWSVGGGYGETTNRTSLNIDSQKFSVKFEVLRVRVNRPWMDASVFGAKTWDWTVGSIYDQQLISDGQNDGHTAPSGIAPFLITEILLARNVELTGDWTTELHTTYHDEKNGGGHVGWGPFSFGGNYSSTYDEAHDNTKISGNTISSPDVQIIGALVQILAKSPDADRVHYKWPTRSVVRVSDIDTTPDISRLELSSDARDAFDRLQASQAPLMSLNQ